MTDNLVKRLRAYKEKYSCSLGYWWQTPEVCDEAADRIEALIRERDALTAERDALKAENERLREAALDAAAHLVAATSLLRKGGKKAAPSNKMFAQMLVDYEAAIERTRAALQETDNG
jgi:hypothetical protein